MVAARTKKLLFVLALAIFLLAFILGLLMKTGGSSRGVAYTVTVRLSGAPGVAFNGEYMRQGKRIVFSGALPWSLEESNVSRFEVRKMKVQDTLSLDAQGGGSKVSAASGPDSKGIRLNTEGGWNVEFLR